MARAIYCGPSKEDLQAAAEFGLGAADFEQVVEVWSCNEDSVFLFTMMATQWNYAGMGQRTGLRYEAAEAVIGRCYLRDLPSERKDELFADLRVMEMEALNNG